MTDAPAATLEDEDDDELESYVDFRKSGGIHLVTAGEKRRLRPPRMREYRTLSSMWRDELETLESSATEMQAFLVDLLKRGDEREKNGQPRITDEERAKDREYGMAIRDAQERASLAWWVECVRMLGVTDRDRYVEDDGDLPVFLTSVDSVNAALNHWRSVPSRSGVR